MFLSELDDDVPVHLLQYQAQRVVERRLHLRTRAGLVVREDQTASLVHNVHTDDAHPRSYLLVSCPDPTLERSGNETKYLDGISDYDIMT